MKNYSLLVFHLMLELAITEMIRSGIKTRPAACRAPPHKRTTVEKVDRFDRFLGWVRRPVDRRQTTHYLNLVVCSASSTPVPVKIRLTTNYPSMHRTICIASKARKLVSELCPRQSPQVRITSSTQPHRVLDTVPDHTCVSSLSTQHLSTSAAAVAAAVAAAA